MVSRGLGFHLLVCRNARFYRDLVQDKPAQKMAGVLPLSWPQEGVWFFEQSSPGTSAYNIAEAWWLEGPVDIAALQFSLNELVHRHETFRTAIGAKDGKPCQIVLPPKAFPLFHVDIRFREKAASEAERLAASDARIAFDLEQEPLARVILIHFGDGNG